MASEVALALILVAGAGLLATSLTRLYRVGFGFDPAAVVNLELNMDKQALQGEALDQLYSQIKDGLTRLPGVDHASFAMIVPLTNNVWDQEYSVAGGKRQDLNLNGIMPDYFATMRIPLLEGRDFSANDTATSGGKIILNQSAAKIFFPSGAALGQQLWQNEKEKKSFTVVGVVGDIKYEDLRSPAPPGGYIPLTQRERPKASYTAVVRMSGGSAAQAASLAAAARSLLNRLAPEIPAPVVTSMSRVVDDSVSAERMMAILSVYFALCALLVTAIGLYGTLAYSTARRTPEIGIRMALGAKRAQVVALIFRENAAVALFGSAAGLASALLASRALESFLYGTSARDPWVLGSAVMALVLIASAASLLPALRAARIDPMAAIRCE